MTQPYLLKPFTGEDLKRPPIWFMRQAGRYLSEYKEIRKNFSSFLDFCYSPDEAAQVTIQPVDRFDLDAAIIFSDILVIPDALGMDVQFKPSIGPVLDLITSEKDINALSDRFSDVMETLHPVTKTVSQTRAHLAPEKAVIGFCGGPWTVAAYMCDPHPSKDTLNLRKLAYENPSAFQKLIDTLMQASIIYLKAQIEAGADMIMLFESWAGVVPSDLFETAVLAPLTKITQALKETYPHIPVIAFGRNSTYGQLEQLAKGPFNGLGLSHTVDLNWAAQNIQPHKVIQGNLDPAFLLTTPQIVEEETKKMLHIATQNPHYICNLGHGINKDTPVENVEAFVNTVKTWQTS